MEILLRHLNLYTVNEITFNSVEIELDKNKKYVLAIFVNNELLTLCINYKFVRIISSKYCRFSHDNNCFDFNTNDHYIKTNIFELADDFNHTYFADLLLTHYNKKNARNINDVYMYTKYCKICKYSILTNDILIKLSLINNNIY